MYSALCIFLFLQHCVFQVRGNASYGCENKDISSSFLDSAIDMINKAKLYLPQCQNRLWKPMDCAEVQRSGHNESGVYTIWPKSRILNDKPIDVFCDMDTDGGGWTVIQRRGNFGREKDYFFKNWTSYKEGFGDIKKDFWLGNDNIYALAQQRLTSIRFDLQAVDGEKRYAVYDDFWIEDERDKYRLHINSYRGDAGDSMSKEHNNQQFSTKDQKNDVNLRSCAQEFKGAWWYQACHQVNLNAIDYRGAHESKGDGVNWFTFKGYHESLDATEMKLRPKNFPEMLTQIDTLCIK